MGDIDEVSAAIGGMKQALEDQTIAFGQMRDTVTVLGEKVDGLHAGGCAKLVVVEGRLSSLEARPRRILAWFVGVGGFLGSMGVIQWIRETLTRK